MRRLRSLAGRSVQSAGGRLETQAGDPPVYGQEAVFEARFAANTQQPNTCQGLIVTGQTWAVRVGSTGVWIITADWQFSRSLGTWCGGEFGQTRYFDATSGFFFTAPPWTSVIWYNVGVFPLGTRVTVRELI